MGGGEDESANLARAIQGCARAGKIRTAQLRGKRSTVLPMGRENRLADVELLRSQIALPETAD